MGYFKYISKHDHKLLPVLLFVLVVFQAGAMAFYHLENKKMVTDYSILQGYGHLYVVPGAKAGSYDPSKPEVLLTQEVNYILTMLNTYTPETFVLQYDAVRSLFGNDILKMMDTRANAKRIEVLEDELSTKLIVDSDSYEITEDKQNNYSYNVAVEGSMQYIMAGKIVQAVPLRYTMTFSRRYISQQNPYGFVMDSYKVKQI